MKRFLKIIGVVLLLIVLVAIWGRYESVAHPRRFLSMMRGYLGLVDGYTTLAKDPVATGVAASLGAKDLLEQSATPQEAVSYFERVLQDVRDDVVRRSVRVQLAELYKKTGQNEKALEQYRLLMIEPGATAATQPSPL